MVTEAARRNAFHPVRDYLAGLEWDGVKRIDTWLTTYAGAEDTPYARAVGAITLVAAARRVRKPGCKFDEMLILDWFSDYLPLHADGKKAIEQLVGKWLIEAANSAARRGPRLLT